MKFLSRGKEREKGGNFLTPTVSFISKVYTEASDRGELPDLNQIEGPGDIVPKLQQLNHALKIGYERRFSLGYAAGAVGGMLAGIQDPTAHEMLLDIALARTEPGAEMNMIGTQVHAVQSELGLTTRQSLLSVTVATVIGAVLKGEIRLPELPPDAV